MTSSPHRSADHLLTLCVCIWMLTDAAFGWPIAADYRSIDSRETIDQLWTLSARVRRQTGKAKQVASDIGHSLHVLNSLVQHRRIRNKNKKILAETRKLLEDIG